VPLPSDPADLFAELVRDFGANFNRPRTFDWLHDNSVRDIADLLEQAALREGEIDPVRVEELLEAVDRDEDDDDDAYSRRTFAILAGLDRALLYVNPYFGSFDQGALTPIAVRYSLTGVLNTDPTSGAVLPRCSYPGRVQHTPNTLNDAFVGVVWVPAEDWKRTDHRRLPARNDLTRVEREGEVVIACTPFVDDANDFNWDITERHENRFYRVSLKDGPPRRDRIAPLLMELDGSEATIAMLPELTLTPELLAAWRSAIDDVPQPPLSNLKWLFIGTGDLGNPSPENRSVLIDRCTGEVVLEQLKIYPFTLTSEQLAEWHLDTFLGTDAIEEDLSSCDARVTVAESRLGRVAMLVCEDLARIVDLGRALRSHGISHVFSPVFSKETLPHYWEHQKAKDYATEAGTLVVVANSLVVPRLMKDDGPWGTAIVHSPATTQTRSTYNARDIAKFRVACGDPIPGRGDPPVDRADDESRV